jgi:hypothetical protein
MVPDRAAQSGAGHGVMTRQVTGYATNHRTFDTAMRLGGGRQCPSREQ